MKHEEETTELSLVTPARWEEARRRHRVLHPLASDPNRTRADVAAAAHALGLRPARVYGLLKRLSADPRLSSLLPRRSGGVRGRSRLSTEMDLLIDEIIEEQYLTRQQPTIVSLLSELRRLCMIRGLTPPSRKAITKRIRAKPAAIVTARRQGPKAAADRFRPVTGSFEATGPLSVVQMDHTLVDAIVVDSVTRLPLQRPWITIAIDVFTRCVVGMHLSLEPPSATSVALCIAHAVLPKQAWLAKRQIDAEWPMQGLMGRLHLDNAKEFRSEALRRGCEQYGIAIDYRPVRTPHYGGHIERLIGTVMGKVHLLPGTTFSGLQEKGDIDPEKTAAMTIDELERWLGYAIAGDYHGTPHRALAKTPFDAWSSALTSGGMSLKVEGTAIADPRRFLIDFLPIERRLVRRDGISLHSIHYWSDVLATWIGEKERMIVRYDPRDLSRVYLRAPDGRYYDLPYRDLRRPPISLWEHRLALKRLRDQGHAQFDEHAIFRTIEDMREIVDMAVVASKSARRQRERRLRIIQGGLAEPLPQPSETLSVNSQEFDRPPYEDMLPVEEWT